MVRFASAVLVLCVALAFPAAVNAGTITFESPALAASTDCAPQSAFAPLQILEEGGVQFRVENEQLGNRYPCDLGATVVPTGFPQNTSTPFHPLIPADGTFDPITIWQLDHASIHAKSFGVALLGLTIDADVSTAPPCAPTVKTDTGLTFQVCDSGGQTFWFADFGAAPGTVHGFDLFFNTSNPGLARDPFVQLLAVEVPEPASLILFGLAGIPMAFRTWRRVNNGML